MKIEIWSDFACPFCYIAKTRFEEALDKFPHKDKVQVEYKSFILDPNAPLETNLSGVEQLAKSKGITVDRAREMYANVVKMAKTAGLNYNLDTMQATNTNDAHRLAQWAKQFKKDRELTNKLFSAYFIEGLNIADHNILANIAESIGLDSKKAREVLAFDEFEIAVDTDINDAQMLGIQSVPTFVVNREFGVSGAQKEEYFLNMLHDTYNKMHPTKLNITDDGSACGPDGCDI